MTFIQAESRGTGKAGPGRTFAQPLHGNAGEGKTKRGVRATLVPTELSRHRRASVKTTTYSGKNIGAD